jgi:hypothetical protein
MLARMEWDDLFGALIGLQQLECVPQVFLPEGARNAPANQEPATRRA